MSTNGGSNLDPIVEAYVRNLMSQAEHIGTCVGIIRVSELKTGSNRNKGNLDRFKISIPYGGQYIKWEVIFNSNNLNYPPDFIFLSDNGQFIPEITNLKSLVNWQLNDTKSLFNVVKELISEYKRYNLQKLENTQLLSQYTQLLTGSPSIVTDTSDEEEADISDSKSICLEQNVEAYVQSENGQILLMIKLALDFTNLPKYITEDKSSDNKVLSVITYPNLDFLKGVTKICLSPRLERAFNLIGGLKSPQLNKDLKDYVIETTDIVQKQVYGLGHSFGLRKSFIASLSYIYPQTLEFDSLYFNKINVFVTINNYSFILYVNIPWIFPAQKPCLNLISLYNQKQNRGRSSVLVSKSLVEYPYSPRWTAEEMAARIKSFIEEEVVNFQKEQE